MASILFGSIVRNGESYLPRYFNQLNALSNEHQIGLAITEGDSTDNTAELIKKLPRKFKLYDYTFNHSGNLYGSVNAPERWRNIARTWNFMLDKNFLVLQDYDYFCYMEADLIWSKNTINQLLSGMKTFNAVAPMSMLGNLFYDTWGHRAFNENFTNTYPFHSAFLHYERYMPLQSAGSCILMDSFVAQSCRLKYEDAMIGHDIVNRKFTFMLDKHSIVNHP